MMQSTHWRNNRRDYFHSGPRVKASMILMGLGQILQKQIMKGLIYLSIFGGFIFYLWKTGVKDIIGFFTLGTVRGDAWLGIEGDNSIIMLLRGILAFMIVIAFILVYRSNLEDVYESELKLSKCKELPGFLKALEIFMDRKFYKVSLAVPIAGVLIFSILPIIFMILIAFTNFGGEYVPPELIDWIGFGNFEKIFNLSDIKVTLGKILLWNIIWAVSATALNYFGGLGLALLLNKKCVKGRAFWRTFPIVAYAVPGFITLLGFKFMFSYGGPINYYIKLMAGTTIGFLDIDAGIRAKVIGLLVNAWISIPTSMLLATGILSNMNNDLYDAASIDGANGWKKFTKITLPFVVFSTTPVLITSFVGNFNNFGIFYFLRGGLYNDGYFLASDTDLLINWLYNLSIDNNYYSIGAAVSLIIFIITSILSLSVYVRSNAYRKEDTFR